MKNKDGIELRVGQVTEFEAGVTRTILGFTPTGLVIYWYEKKGVKRISWSHTPDDDIFRRILECPLMGNMRNHLIVTQEQRDKYKRPDCAEWFDDDDDTWNLPSFKKWIDDYPYRVPADFDGWELKEEAVCFHCHEIKCKCGLSEHKPAKPQFKLFEIDWRLVTWPVIKVEKEVHDAIVGIQVDVYRITCFTDCDNVEKIMRKNGELSYNKLSDDPITYHGKKKKYAVGVLEND